MPPTPTPIPIYILIIDDNREYCNGLRNRFYTFGVNKGKDIRLSDFQNLEDGFAELSKNSNYKALILDGQCLITRAQEKAGFDFLPVAMDRLSELNRQTGRHYIPFAVCTGYYERYQDQETLVKEKRGRMFDKAKGETQMLEYLLEEIEKALETKLEKEFPDIFEVFAKGYLPDEQRKNLVEILKNKDNPAQISTTLGSLRRFQESIYNTLEENGKVNTNRNMSFKNRNKRLSGEVAHVAPYQATQTIYQTQTIEHLANAIYKIGSAYGAHAPEEPIHVAVQYWENPSIYVTQSLVFALLEQILWFKKLMEQP
jgi:hypothetical protein